MAEKRSIRSVAGDIDGRHKIEMPFRSCFEMPVSLLQDKVHLAPINLSPRTIGDFPARSSVLYGGQMYDAALERYIPVLMAMARIYWDRENYPMVEKLFRQAAEFCSDHDTWKLNAAHVFFMEEKFKVRTYFLSFATQPECQRVYLWQLAGAPCMWSAENFRDFLSRDKLLTPHQYSLVQEAIRYYEPIVKRQADTILEVPAIVLANLCVSHIMISQNEEAEELMRKVGDIFSCGNNCTCSVIPLSHEHVLNTRHLRCGPMTIRAMLLTWRSLSPPSDAD